MFNFEDTFNFFLQKTETHGSISQLRLFEINQSKVGQQKMAKKVVLSVFNILFQVF